MNSINIDTEKCFWYCFNMSVALNTHDKKQTQRTSLWELRETPLSLGEFKVRSQWSCTHAGPMSSILPSIYAKGQRYLTAIESGQRPRQTSLNTDDTCIQWQHPWACSTGENMQGLVQAGLCVNVQTQTCRRWELGEIWDNQIHVWDKQGLKMGV